ncbi:MAG: Hpt domain-containing protein [Bacteroidia bacterium]|jgi:HPt (histidine-containing phosphotransfer) domain-containing protein
MQLDLTYLESVSGGDSAFIKEILQMFITHTLPDSVILKQHIEESDWTKVSSTAHKMKSSISMLGDQELMDRILKLEQASRTLTDLEQIPEMFATLEVQLERMGRMVTNYINTK